MDEIEFDEDDILYEEDILRNPYMIKPWMRYIEYKRDGSVKALNSVYERALKQLPGCYKIWYSYLKARREQIEKQDVGGSLYNDVNHAFEKALVYMHKMPRIWIDYCEFMMKQPFITRTRHIFDRALRALPITQHNRIWPLYLSFVTECGVEETAVRVYRRYLKLCPEDTEDYIKYLIEIKRLDEAAVKLAEILNKENFVSKYGKSSYQLWTELCSLICENPDKVISLNVDAIIRGGISRYTDQLGSLWTSLASYYIRSGLFDRANDIYEEAMESVTTVRDFTQIFDAYSQCEQTILLKKIEEREENPNIEIDDDIDIELRLARLEYLKERHLLLLNSVMLRQNPHNVQEWLKRVELYEGKPQDIINTYTEAVQTIDPKLAVGKLYTLWVSFAKFYEEHQQLKDADIIFEKAIQVPFLKVDDLATVWCEWAEMKIRQNDFKGALKLMQRATVLPTRKVAYFDDAEPIQMRLHKSLKIWSMYADLEESLGTFQSCKAVYDRIIDLKIATPQIIVNYASFLEDNKYFSLEFQAYEKGVSLFKWPNVYDIWKMYLRKFLDHYKGTKISQTRDLFIQCLEHCPPKYAKEFYIMFAKMEETYPNTTSARNILNVYEKAVSAVLPEEKFEMYNTYISKAASVSGIRKIREIYEKAILDLDGNDSRQMCINYAKLETKLGEIERARAIYVQCSQVCDPRVTSDFWEMWSDFEVAHGNEDTLMEMLRIKRSVQTQFNIQVNMMSAQMLAAASNASGTVSDLAPGAKDGMRMLEAKATEVSANSGKIEKKKSSGIDFVRGETINPDEINIDESSDDDDDKNNEENEYNIENEIAIEKKEVPLEVFGNMGKGGKVTDE
ncbi:hypothetical protein PGB90_003633 [Kerria lacca]